MTRRLLRIFSPFLLLLCSVPLGAQVRLNLAQDPLQEKYFHTSHYSFSLNNPVSNVDFDGRVVFIKGSNQQDALDLLQTAVGEKLMLSINEKGRLSYEMAKEGRLGSKAKLIAKIIDDSEIYVNLETKSDNHNSLGGILVGGAFMGNELLNDNSIVRTHQEISTETLLKADVKDNHNIGKNILHELSESYFGGLISKNKKTAAPPAEPNGNNPIFERAHRRATPQSKIIKAVNKSDSDNSIVSEQYYVNEIEPEQLILNHSY